MAKNKTVIAVTVKKSHFKALKPVLSESHYKALQR